MTSGAIKWTRSIHGNLNMAAVGATYLIDKLHTYTYTRVHWGWGGSGDRGSAWPDIPAPIFYEWFMKVSPYGHLNSNSECSITWLCQKCPHTNSESKAFYSNSSTPLIFFESNKYVVIFYLNMRDCKDFLMYNYTFLKSNDSTFLILSIRRSLPFCGLLLYS